MRDNINDQTELFIDGKLEVLSTSKDSIGSNHNLFFGKSFRPDFWGEYFNGLIDDIRIYNRVLSEAEIKALYNLGN